ncbi:MAG: hypothetical protein M5R36_14230 [Deltaproteobacteria bacterium]|nr:hypothetical protein [Deltaproteobacteria bacterium]
MAVSRDFEIGAAATGGLADDGTRDEFTGGTFRDDVASRSTIRLGEGSAAPDHGAGPPGKIGIGSARRPDGAVGAIGTGPAEDVAPAPDAG